MSPTALGERGAVDVATGRGIASASAADNRVENLDIVLLLARRNLRDLPAFTHNFRTPLPEHDVRLATQRLDFGDTLGKRSWFDIARVGFARCYRLANNELLPGDAHRVELLDRRAGVRGSRVHDERLASVHQSESDITHLAVLVVVLSVVVLQVEEVELVPDVLENGLISAVWVCAALEPGADGRVRDEIVGTEVRAERLVELGHPSSRLASVRGIEVCCQLSCCSPISLKGTHLHNQCQHRQSHTS